MRKEKEERNRSICDECGNPLMDKEVFNHTGINYCRECITKHIENEHSKDVDTTHPLATPEGRRAWTYKST